MPWRDLLSPAQRAQVMALPTGLREYEELYTLTPADQEFVAAHRISANRLDSSVTAIPFGRRSAMQSSDRPGCRHVNTQLAHELRQRHPRTRSRL